MPITVGSLVLGGGSLKHEVFFGTSKGIFRLHSKVAWLSILRGAGLVVAGYWSLLLLPVLVIGFLSYGLCIVYTMGIGILAIPLFLICMATAAAPLYLFYGFLRSTNLERHRGPWLIGILLGLGLLLIVEGPSYVTRL